MVLFRNAVIGSMDRTDCEVGRGEESGSEYDWGCTVIKRAFCCELRG